jgi:hypothetical protein
MRSLSFSLSYSLNCLLVDHIDLQLPPRLWTAGKQITTTVIGIIYVSQFSLERISGANDFNDARVLVLELSIWLNYSTGEIYKECSL